MSNDAVEIMTPSGRMVQGDAFEPQTKDAQGNPLTVKSGPNAGQPRVNYFVAIAIPKTDPGWPEIWAKINAVARAGFPTLFDTAGTCIAPAFAFKVTDGDSTIPNQRNIRPCDREGFPGNWILNFSNGFPPECFDQNVNKIVDKNAIKRGYFIRVLGSIVSNNSPSTPGIYLNVGMIQLVGFGDEIRTSPDGAAIFGGTPMGALPPGASATPLAPSTAPAVPGAPGAPAAPVAPVVPAVPIAAPTAPGVPPVPVTSTVQPAPNFLHPQGAPATPAVPVAPVAATAPTTPVAPAEMYRIHNGVRIAESVLRANTWTEAQIAGLPQG